MIQKESLQPSDVWSPQSAGFSHEQPFSQGLKITGGDSLIFVAGQVALDISGEVVGEGDTYRQTVKSLSNMESVLQEADATMKDVVKLTFFVTDMDMFAEVKKARAEFIPQNPPATITSVEVQSLARPELLVEIDAIALTD